MKARIYTDGACSGNPGPGGWAANILMPEGSAVISGHENVTTNNRMELKAMVEALKRAIQLGYTRIDAYSDSAYVVNAVKKEWLRKWEFNNWKTVQHEDVKNKDLWLELLSILNRRIDINIVKVKGHTGNINNEMVDKLAKSETEIAKEEVAKYKGARYGDCC